MPVKKVGNEYEGPSGKKFNKAQVALYYAGGGKFPGQSKSATSTKKTPTKKRVQFLYFHQVVTVTKERSE